MRRRTKINFLAGDPKLTELGFEHASPEEAEECEYVACARKDDLKNPDEGADSSVCCACGAEVWLHPKDPRKPAKICTVCAIQMSQEMH